MLTYETTEICNFADDNTLYANEKNAAASGRELDRPKKLENFMRIDRKELFMQSFMRIASSNQKLSQIVLQYQISLNRDVIKKISKYFYIMWYLW